MFFLSVSVRMLPEIFRILFVHGFQLVGISAGHGRTAFFHVRQKLFCVFLAFGTDNQRIFVFETQYHIAYIFQILLGQPPGCFGRCLQIAPDEVSCGLDQREIAQGESNVFLIAAEIALRAEL